jgi:adenosylmethionine-8-amino-7-oxononanoate aminotransferase
VKHVNDIRNFGLAGALQIEARAGEPLRRPYEIALAMWERGFYVRWGGDTLAVRTAVRQRTRGPAASCSRHWAM